MKIISRQLFFLALPAIAFSVSGCAGGGAAPAGSTPGGDFFSALRDIPIFRNAAQGILVGKTIDRAAVAERNDDLPALQAAVEELKEIDPLAAAERLAAQQLAAAEQLVLSAEEHDARASTTQNAVQKKQLEAQAALKYRAALKTSPGFRSSNQHLLNVLGYFLADRGKTQADFKAAERLTRAALKIWDESIAQTESVPLFPTRAVEARFNRAQGPQDSLAWALFRQGRFNEARKEQVAAVKTCEEAAPQLGQPISADVYFHLGEIERALNHFDAAKANYLLALKNEPDHAPSLNALRALGPRSTPGGKIPNGEIPGESPSTPDAPSPLPAPETGALQA